VKTAPSVDRAVAILNVIGQDRRQGMTLGEVVRRTGFAKATCHSILASLVEARWVLRHPVGPTYRLGPGLIALGHSAGRGFPALPFAEAVMQELAESLQIEGLVTAAVGDEIVVLAKAGEAAPLSVSVSVGQRLPFAPPLASVFVAWQTEAEIDALLDGSTAPERKRYLAAVAAVRRRGFTVVLDSPGLQPLVRALADSADHGRHVARGVDAMLARLGREDYHLLDLRGSQTYAVNHLSAPVFDAVGAVTVALTLTCAPLALTGRDVDELGRRLRAAADTVTGQVHGRRPDAASRQVAR
jgi:DNA-binding IclR family transcriptional regulator